MNFDVLFVTPGGNRPFAFESLNQPGFGGVEWSTIRLAEEFASRGAKVGVAQRFPLSQTFSPNGVEYFGPINEVDWKTLKAKNMIFVRTEGKWDLFPDSKKFLWFHDMAEAHVNNPSSWVEGMIKHEVLGICVSDWHRENILKHAPGMPLKRIYPLIDEECFHISEKLEFQGYNKNQLVWCASPHKGLNQAIEIFDKIVDLIPDMHLLVFNPGYFEIKFDHPNIIDLCMSDRKTMREIVSQSLCMFYPTDFEETFGMIAAEANAMGVPVASYKIAGLAESSLGPFSQSKEEIIQQILFWRSNGPPKIQGQEKFRMKNVIPQWAELFQ